ncbi:MAG: ribonuclease J [Chloroflexi bacterium]|nr:ribonuclease J [Chloroflexota bacterium]
MADKLRVIPLGGLGEIGKNMMVFELGDDLILVDAGLMFPEADMLGVDLVIPDVSYVANRIGKLRGIVITHGHEDHTGALPYVLPQLRLPNGKLPPIYCSRLTHGLISVKLHEHKLDKEADLHMVKMGQTVRLGKFTVEWVRVTHSIPDSAGLAIRTPAGNIFHTGDFKLDHTPIMGEPTDLLRIAELGREGVMLLLSDSTYAETPGYTPSEYVVGDALDEITAHSSGRVIIATFASLISRVQQIIDASYANGRHVFVTGRSMMDNVKMALKQKYLEAPEDILVPLEKMRGLPPEQITIITTGAQGEPTSALARMANRDHRHIEIVEGDTVVLSSSPIPGNELLINHTIDNLYRLGARVLYSRIANVHVHGHAAQEELKIMLSLVQPHHFVPIHGEYRHLVMHAGLARAMGVAEENAFVLEDGDILEIDASGAKVVGRAPADYVYVDGLAVGVDRVVIRDRQHLAADGVIVAIVSIDKHTGKPIGLPDVVSRGFIEADMSDSLMERAGEVILESLAGAEHVAGRGDFNTRVHDALSRFLYDETRRRPMVLPLSVEV